MTTITATMWGIHCDEPTLDFLGEGFISLGWELIPDVRTIGADKEKLKAAFAEAYPEAKAGAIPVWAGLFMRFGFEMQPDDLIVYPDRATHTVNIGEITGDYEYHPEVEKHRHRRAVTWLQTGIARSTFSQGALYEIGCAVTLFRVKNHDGEFRAQLTGNGAPPAATVAAIVGTTASADETSIAEDEPNAERIRETTADFVLRTLAKEMKGHPFARFTAHLLEGMGYKTKVSPEGPDGGIDVVAHKDALGLEPPIIKVQCKSTEGKVGGPEVQALLGTLGSRELGLFVTLGYYSNDAKQIARGRQDLRLIGGQELVELVFEHYESFSPEYQRVIPLKQVFVADPEPTAS
jgi:restriction system protein